MPSPTPEADPGPGPEPAPIVQLSTREVYRNAWIHVREDVVRFANGHEGIYGVVTTPGAVGVLPFVDADHVALIRQFRYVAGRPTWEMPTGAPNAGETIEETARRELAEEAGLQAGRLEHVATIHTSKSVVDEQADLFIARDLVQVHDGNPDITEQLDVRVFRFDEVLAMVERSEIVDAMTVVAVLHAARRRV
jgi:8-oxo-dGTP pyrophosphatase MutT (NUDIX family)